jgi:hypothetical protein
MLALSRILFLRQEKTEFKNDENLVRFGIDLGYFSTTT